MRSHLASSDEWRLIVASTLEQMGIAAWDYDLATGELWWSDNAGPLYGRPRGFTPANFQEATSLTHPDDRKSATPADLESNVALDPSVREVRALLPDGSVRWLSHRVFLIRDEHGAPTRIAGLMIDIDAEKRRESRQALLTEASRMLTSSLEYETTLKRVAEVIVPSWADWCAVYLLAGNRLLPIVIGHRDPEKVRWARELLERYPPSTADTDPRLAKILGDRTGELITDVTDDILQAAAQDEQHLELLRTVGLRSAARVPLVSGDRVLGMMTLVTADSNRRFNDEDLAFAEDLGGRVATAIDNSMLHAEATAAHDHARSVAERLARLQQVTDRLSQAYRIDEIAALTIEEVLRAAEADRGVLLLNDDHGKLQLVAAPGYPPERVASWEPEIVSGGGPAGVSYGQGVPVYVESRVELKERFHDLGTMADTALGESWATLPLMGSEGPRGVLGLTFDIPRRFTADDRAMMQALVRQCAIALERSHLFESQRRTVDALQRGLIPDAMPVSEAVRLAVHYHIGGLAKVGGDWYDAFLTDSEEVALVIGDVVGRGIPAVGTMAQLRNGLRAYLVEGHSPAESLTLLNRLLARRMSVEQGLATVCCMLYDPASGRLRWSRAGHPPPMLCHPSGEIERLLVMSDIPLAVEPSYVYEERERSIEPGTLLVLYTDGLVERRDEDLDTSLDRLEAVLATTNREPVSVVEHLLARLPSQPSPDDVAVLVAELGAPA